MKIFIQDKNKKINRSFSGRVAELLTQLKINPNIVLVVRDKEIITEDDVLSNNDSIELLNVVSGG